jgi:hypothetical protein
VRGETLSVNSVVKAQHGMIRGTIEFEERSSYPTGKFDELIQDMEQGRWISAGRRENRALQRKRVSAIG